MLAENGGVTRSRRYLEGGEGVRGDVEGGHLHVVEETVEMFRMENYLGERLVADALPQHDPAVQRYLRRLVPSDGESVSATLFGSRTVLGYVSESVSPFQQDEQDLLVGTEIFDGGAPRPDLPPQDVVEDLTHIFLPLKDKV